MPIGHPTGDETEGRHGVGQAERLCDRGAIQQPERCRRRAETDSARGEEKVCTPGHTEPPAPATVCGRDLGRVLVAG